MTTSEFRNQKTDLNEQLRRLHARLSELRSKRVLLQERRLILKDQIIATNSRIKEIEYATPGGNATGNPEYAKLKSDLAYFKAGRSRTDSRIDGLNRDIRQLIFRINALENGHSSANVIGGGAHSGQQSVASEVVPLPENPTFQQLHYHLRSR